MQLSPRYELPPVIDITAVVTDPSEVFSRQRDRLARVLSTLSDEEWETESRCQGWSVQDVGEHLVGVNQFWQISIEAGLRGEPTQFLASFDPVTVPAAMVERARGEPPAATLEKLVQTNEGLASLLASFSDGDWEKVAEAPPGHLTMDAVCAHGLWDAWIHERDVLLPLGLAQEIEADEVATALAYVAALSPAFYLNTGASRVGSLAVQAGDAGVSFTVDVAAQVRVVTGTPTDATAVIQGHAVELLEALSGRAPLPSVAVEHRWLVDGLQRAFDTILPATS